MSQKKSRVAGLVSIALSSPRFAGCSTVSGYQIWDAISDRLSIRMKSNEKSALTAIGIAMRKFPEWQKTEERDGECRYLYWRASAEPAIAGPTLRRTRRYLCWSGMERHGQQ